MRLNLRLLVTFIIVVFCHVRAWAQLTPYSSNPLDLCPKLPPRVPNGVRDLSPQNVNLVISLGDSISAGWGMMGLKSIHFLSEWRGRAFFSGGDSNQTTVANFLKRFSSSLLGASYGRHLVELRGSNYQVDDQLNAAQSEARSQDLNWQIARLRRVLSPHPNLTKAWKLVSIFIGANDVCQLCNLTLDQQVNQFAANLESALSSLAAAFPNTLVAVTSVFNLSGVYQRVKSLYCKSLHLIPWECKCVLHTNAAGLRRADEAATRMRQRAREIVARFQAKNLTKFGVTYLPFTEGVDLNTFPTEMVSSLDCFHPSYICHQQLAIGVWNQLFTPAYLRSSSWRLGIDPMCPSPNMRFHV